jgi:uncharacterized protein HemX
MLEAVFFHLAATSSNGEGSGEIITIVYILTGVSLIIGFAVGTYKYVQRQKKKWLDEGVTRQKQNQAMAENTTQMMKNTEAIALLTSEFGKFAMSVRENINGLGVRLGRLEVWRREHSPDHSKEQ